LRALACALLVVIFPIRSPAESSRWFEVRSGNFLLFTDTSEAKGRRMLVDLEQRLATFQAAFGTVPLRQFPIEILLFNHSEDFISSAPAPVPPDTQTGLLYTSAYFLKGPDRDFVVAQDKSPEDIDNDIG